MLESNLHVLKPFLSDPYKFGVLDSSLLCIWQCFSSSSQPCGICCASVVQCSFNVNRWTRRRAIFAHPSLSIYNRTLQNKTQHNTIVLCFVNPYNKKTQLEWLFSFEDWCCFRIVMLFVTPCCVCQCQCQTPNLEYEQCSTVVWF